MENGNIKKTNFILPALRMLNLTFLYWSLHVYTEFIIFLIDTVVVITVVV